MGKPGEEGEIFLVGLDDAQIIGQLVVSSGFLGNNAGACKPSVLQINTIRFGGACSLAHAGCIDSSHGNAIATPVLCKKVRRFSVICSKIIGFALRHEATLVQGSYSF